MEGIFPPPFKTLTQVCEIEGSILFHCGPFQLTGGIYVEQLHSAVINISLRFWQRRGKIGSVTHPHHQT